ncbi:hypothetical protein ASF41_22465 [Methylobacterium sp. Leaf111]|nr:hypothetical protein ASF41_22465 [Methylobacterium sp. Leaf111]
MLLERFNVVHRGKPKCAGKGDKILQASGLGLTAEVEPVGLYRSGAEVQPARHLLVAEPRTQQAQYLCLAMREGETMGFRGGSRECTSFARQIFNTQAQRGTEIIQGWAPCDKTICTSVHQLAQLDRVHHLNGH